MWDRSGKLLKSVGHPGMVYAIAFRTDGKAVATGGGRPREDLAGTAVVWGPVRLVGEAAVVGEGRGGGFGGVLAGWESPRHREVRRDRCGPRPEAEAPPHGRPSRAWCFR